MNTLCIHQYSNSLNESYITIEIEKFVNELIFLHSNGLDIHNQLTHQAQLWRQLYLIILGSLDRYLMTYSLEHAYTEHPDAFWYGCQSAGLLPSQAHYGMLRHRMQAPSFVQVQILVRGIIEYSQSYRLFKRRTADRLSEMKKKNARQELDACMALNNYSRSLVVVCMLGINQDSQHLVNISHFYRLYETLVKELETNELFKGTLFTTKGIEQGKSKGYHLHLGLVFNGNERCYDEYIALKIRALWMGITLGLDTFQTSNTKEKKEEYREKGLLGVGMIHRIDSLACGNANRVLCYTTKINKTDQYLRMKPKGKRSHAHGIAHRVRHGW